MKGGNVLFSVPRIYPRRIALAVMFLMTARTFYFFPGMSIPSEVWNLLSAGFLAFVYLGWKIKVKGRFETFEFYVLILMVLMPLWSGFMAMQVFGQPMIFGVLSQRTMVLGTGALALLLFYKAGWIDSNACRQAFLIPAWATLILYSAYQVYLQTGFSLNAPKARFVYAFVEIGFYYYAITGFNRKSKAHFLLALPFFVYIISTGQRALLLTTI
ncbi:MAG TPA: hypothetical protein VFX38_07625, partial [Gammaproteobacteria bacterium]|nr:hypothetical protein [Gammaproteobacteria bacterium]